MAFVVIQTQNAGPSNSFRSFGNNDHVVSKKEVIKVNTQFSIKTWDTILVKSKVHCIGKILRNKDEEARRYWVFLSNISSSFYPSGKFPIN